MYMRIQGFTGVYIGVHENGVEKFNSRSKRAFFSRQKLSPKSTI